MESGEGEIACVDSTVINLGWEREERDVKLSFK